MRLIFILLCACACLAAADPPWQAVQGTKPWFTQLHAKHKTDAAAAAAGSGFDVVFFGDSITAYWSKHDVLWQAMTSGLHAANFGVPSDRTQEMLWRIGDGEFSGLKPRLIVVMAGTNNISARDSDDDIVHGVKAVIAALHDTCPGSTILLLGVLPMGNSPSPSRDKVAALNAKLSGLTHGKDVQFLDFGAGLIGSDGTISKDMLCDGVHPGDAGYQLWARAMAPVMAQLH